MDENIIFICDFGFTLYFSPSLVNIKCNNFKKMTLRIIIDLTQRTLLTVILTTKKICTLFIIERKEKYRKGFVADLHGGGGCPETTQLSHLNKKNYLDPFIV